ncbi:hypothetical protein IAQ61_011853 [Plenodomus lingam]|uniref:uncharacterized protein n=1 Tax=Leptosphaeria maculans TaxID=5022 RepID=UPI0033312545|nr:hypothetical protein IAQ61_011853 [Plenodomus lingam]
MSWTQVDFSCVRYSPVEGAHYFFDSAYPTSIQFLLSGRWEPWDVGWVRYKAQDPDIRRLAEEAEARLIQDPNSKYTPWPEPPPPGPPPAPINAPVSLQADNSAPPNSTHTHMPTPSPEFDLAVDPALQPPQGGYGAAPVNGPNMPYSSPYGQQERQHSAGPTRQEAPPGPRAPIQSGPPDIPSPNHHSMRIPAHNHVQPSQRPPPQPAPSVDAILSRTRETKILLSIDGDGIRGLSALLVIESLVNAICVKVGQRLDPHQIFDLTGGTSLGGVIAILLCRLRMQAYRAREAYKRIAKEVFANKREFFMYLDSGQAPRSGGSSSSEALEKEIRAVVKQELGNEDELLLDGREDSGDVFVISTQIEHNTNKPALLRSYQTRRITGPDLSSTPLPITTALLATVRAPSYTSPTTTTTTTNRTNIVLSPGLADHGTAKNNPVRDILYECRKRFRYANDMMIIVSIGCGDVSPTSPSSPPLPPSLPHTLRERTHSATTQAQKFSTENAALIQRGWMRYFRFNVDAMADVPLAEWEHEERVREVTSAYLGGSEVGARFWGCVEAVAGVLGGEVGGR